MRDLRTPTLAPGARLALAAVALALFGLMSMHGWGSHTPGHSTAMAPASAVTVGSVHNAHSQLAVKDGQAPHGDGNESRGVASAGDGSPGGDQGASQLGLCLAVLTALLLGIGLLLARRQVRIREALLRTRRHSVFRGRDRDPPDLLQLCLIRC